MAFTTLNAQQEINNRKILEDLQLKKQLLQKGGAPVVTTITTLPSNNSFIQANLSLPFQSDMSINSPSRAAWNQASFSSGFFVPQDSVFGNNILPVLPRFDTTLK